MICFGLHGGIGNALFCLPAIKRLAERDDVALYVEGDVPMADLFARCQYVDRVYGIGDLVPRADAYFVGHDAPAAFVRGKIHFKRCGFPWGTSRYDWPEWEQVLREATGTRDRVDVRDWCAPSSSPKSPYVDIGIVPGCKPGDEWSRKKWPSFAEFADAMNAEGYVVEAFGLEGEILEAKISGWWRGPRPLADLPEALRNCRIVVSTDSGIGQLAASLGIPMVMLFTATSPVKGDPVGEPALVKKLSLMLACAPCQSTPRWRECKNWRCRDITVSEVRGAVLDLLARIR